jgi:chromosome segregation ATPase
MAAMADNRKTKRPGSKSLRAGPRHRDPRLESMASRPPPREARADSQRPRQVARVTSSSDLEAQVAHLRNERAMDADELAEMLVRLAAAERTRIQAEQRCRQSEDRCAELEAELGKARAALKEAEQARKRAESSAAQSSSRAAEAEKWVDDVTATIERVQGTLDAGRKRIADLEKQLARATGRGSRPPSSSRSSSSRDEVTELDADEVELVD